METTLEGLHNAHQSNSSFGETPAGFCDSATLTQGRNFVSNLGL